ncbi:MAG: M23 family metallopeptidase [Deltaproteobacteria bacterium]|jgi:murein DD-endopeptidase MepM/ murein hydrolase activator NlpD|nr:M23 family metallopeptidase [Deltaproteobacteria bacterium]
MSEGDGVPSVRSFSASVGGLTVLVFLMVLLFGALVVYSVYSWMTLGGVKDRSMELEILKSQNAGKDIQLLAIGERLEDMDRKLEGLREREKNLDFLTREYNSQLGLPETATLERLWPALTSTVAWTWGGGEGQGGLSATPPSQAEDWRSPAEAIRGIHSNLDRLERNSAGVDLALSELTSALEGSRNLLSATPVSLPVAQGRLTSSFGYRASPFGRGSDMHQGLDLAAPVGTPVYAPAAGTVLTADWSGNGYGLMITVDHGFGLVTRYAHLSEVLVEAGQAIDRGLLIAKVGNTGRSTGPHLHFETVLGAVPVDPMVFIRASSGLIQAANSQGP